MCREYRLQITIMNQFEVIEAARSRKGIARFQRVASAIQWFRFRTDGDRKGTGSGRIESENGPQRYTPIHGIPPFNQNPMRLLHEKNLVHFFFLVMVDFLTYLPTLPCLRDAEFLSSICFPEVPTSFLSCTVQGWLA